MKALLIGLILGLGAGLPGGWYALERFGPQLGLDGREVQGVVGERRVEDDRLQLMLRTPEGESILATFRERASDVAALAHVGDSLTLRLGREDGPIADDPRVVRVQPAEESEESRFAEGDEVPEEPGEEPSEAPAEADQEKPKKGKAGRGKGDPAATPKEAASTSDTSEKPAAERAADVRS